MFSQLGLLVGFLCGAWLDWRQLALVCASAPLMLLVTVQAAPESPSYLVYTGQFARAERSGNVNIRRDNEYTVIIILYYIILYYIIVSW